MVTCSHKVKGRLLLKRNTMTNIDSILKSRDIPLLTKVHIVKAMVFSSGRVQMWDLDHKEGWVSKNWCFPIVVLEKILESPLDGGLSNKSCPTLAIPWTLACQAPLSMRFSREEYWCGLPLSSPGDLPNPKIKPRYPALQADSLLTELHGKLWESLGQQDKKVSPQGNQP